MTSYLCLIAPPDRPALDAGILDRAAGLLPGSARFDWLGEGIAAEAAVSGTLSELNALEADMRALAGDLPIDVAVVPATERRKPLLIADMDSTVIGQECIDELADYVGLRDAVSAITERAMQGELEFEGALRERVALLRGLKVAVIEEILAERIRLTPGAATLVKTMRAHGAHTALVSGGFTRFTGPVAAMAGFEEHHANELIVEDGALTGIAAEPIRGRKAKLYALIDLAARHGLSPASAMAVGDGANDLAMIEAAGLGVAFHAKPAVAAQADVRIDHGDLTALLYLQGYRREEFVG